MHEDRSEHQVATHDLDVDDGRAETGTVADAVTPAEIGSLAILRAKEDLETIVSLWTSDLISVRAVSRKTGAVGRPNELARGVEPHDLLLCVAHV